VQETLVVDDSFYLRRGVYIWFWIRRPSPTPAIGDYRIEFGENPRVHDEISVKDEAKTRFRNAKGWSVTSWMSLNLIDLLITIAGDSVRRNGYIFHMLLIRFSFCVVLLRQCGRGSPLKWMIGRPACGNGCQIRFIKRNGSHVQMPHHSRIWSSERDIRN